jgi:hypothetical protein
MLSRKETHMQLLHSVPWRALRAALWLGAAAAASLALAGTASAAVIVITPDGNGGTTDHLGAAINTANTNSSTSNTIVLSPGFYQPGGAATLSQPFTITKNLTITGDHSFQSNGGVQGGSPGMDINGAAANLKGANNLFVINAGVSVTFQGMNIDSAGGFGFAAILDNGNVTLDGVTMNGTPGFSLQISRGATATLNQSTIENGQTDAVQNAGSLTLNNVTMTSGANNAIVLQPPDTLNMTNTILAFQVGAECIPSLANGGGATNGGPGSLDDDGTCGVQHSDDTNVDSFFPISDNTNGGPATTTELPAGNPDTTGQGVNGPTTDERFFVNPVVGGVPQCDIGAITDSATRQTTAPSCQVTAVLNGPPKQQQVSLLDTASGIGSESGPATDNPSNTIATAYPPPAAVPVPGYAVSNMQIANGTVAFTPFTSPSTSPLVLTASKTTAGTPTQWSFTALNWAGVSKNCF